MPPANRCGHRDSAMILVAFRHGLRSSELADLRWNLIDFTHAVLHVRRAKKGTPATHPIVGTCASCSGSRIPRRRSCSPASGDRRSPRQALPAWWSALVSRPSWAFRPILTCCATPVALRSPTRATIRERCRPTSGTGVFSTLSDTPSCRPAVSRISGDRTRGPATPPKHLTGNRKRARA